MTRQLDLEDIINRPRYPEGPGYRNRDTSRSAADAIAPRVPSLRERVFQAILAKPSTADEVAERLGEPACSVRPRATELSKLGLVIDSGAKRMTEYGRPQIVWTVPQAIDRMAA